MGKGCTHENIQICFKNKVPSSNDINSSQGPPCFTLVLSDFINTLTYNAKIEGGKFI